MLKLSQILNFITIGNPAQAAPTWVAKLECCEIDIITGLPIKNPAPSTSNKTGPDLLASRFLRAQQVWADKVWNAVWNDFADFQKLDDQLIYGKCYFDTTTGAKICKNRCSLSVIGIASDTFGMVVGQGQNEKEVPIAVAGWVLAHVDKEYSPGTPLTNDENGNLTEMTMEEKRNFPERLVAIYKSKEMKSEFGDSKKVKVNGRHWVKVK